MMFCVAGNSGRVNEDDYFTLLLLLEFGSEGKYCLRDLYRGKFYLIYCKFGFQTKLEQKLV